MSELAWERYKYYMNTQHFCPILDPPQAHRLLFKYERANVHQIYAGFWSEPLSLNSHMTKTQCMQDAAMYARLDAVGPSDLLCLTVGIFNYVASCHLDLWCVGRGIVF
jgi:hypothetical protein